MQVDNSYSAAIPFVVQPQENSFQIGVSFVSTSADCPARRGRFRVSFDRGFFYFMHDGVDSFIAILQLSLKQENINF